MMESSNRGRCRLRCSYSCWRRSKDWPTVDDACRPLSRAERCTDARIRSAMTSVSKYRRIYPALRSITDPEFWLSSNQKGIL